MGGDSWLKIFGEIQVEEEMSQACAAFIITIQRKLSKQTPGQADSSAYNCLHKIPFELSYKRCIYSFPYADHTRTLLQTL